MPNTDILIYSLLGGIIPALFWLWFWLREDRLNPEPKNLIINSFIIGMIIVFLVLPLEKYMEKMVVGSFLLIVVWASIEEIFKLIGAYFGGLKDKECNEPIDPMIYLITVALGFAAMENTLFIISSFSSSDNFLAPILTGNLRFIGASLLHVLASGVIGLFLALAFYRKKIWKILFGGVGLLLAILLHSFFNFFIIESEGKKTFIVFCFVWIMIIMLLAAFEKVKNLKPKIKNLKK